MRLDQHLWVIASGAAGFSLTNPYDCSVFLFDGPGGYVLIDCGAGLEPERIKARLEVGGRRPADCGAILLTHGHADHSGGAAWLSRYTGAAVYALGETAGYVQTGDIAAIALEQAIKAGVYPADFQFNRCPVNAVEDGGIVTAAGLDFRALATPGHSSGHCAWFTEAGGRKYLFSGDLVFPGGAISLQPLWDCSPSDYYRSIEKLAALDFDALLPSHHGFLLQNGKDAVLAALSWFQKLTMPPQAV
jgi:glyoxylase-like metal-dependent hydrolase (beta-lactamase superfamily II)